MRARTHTNAQGRKGHLSESNNRPVSPSNSLETDLLAGRRRRNARAKTSARVSASHALTQAEGHAGSSVQASFLPPPPPPTPPHTSLQTCLLSDNPKFAMDHRSGCSIQLSGHSRLPKAEHFYYEFAGFSLFFFSLLGFTVDAVAPNSWPA